ncbi:hypothetical protein ACH5RR_029218 [Cinchona calisaya]|uniref:Uncharacterized protein n=1 Tax=Cinchona calisaya TaxID=153742 RepID=A0ABD2YR11_9GENT
MSLEFLPVQTHPHLLLNLLKDSVLEVALLERSTSFDMQVIVTAMSTMRRHHSPETAASARILAMLQLSTSAIPAVIFPCSPLASRWSTKCCVSFFKWGSQDKTSNTKTT